ncbi:MAG: hypothetical protein A2X48_13055 [Lentisphaerae bacterium GWF2_49_21]|nr:MAG: hypothetical protein A2X48_13055 [Lentisphaerae bacterium GWF2_49_21]
MNKRQDKLLEILKMRCSVDVVTLVEELGASESTIRRDLCQLEDQNLLSRTFGGAKLRPIPSLVAQNFQDKMQQMSAEKERIALKAIELVKPGMTLALDSGSTVWRVAAALRSKVPLTIITCTLSVVEELGTEPDISIVFTGGKFRIGNLDFIGANTVATFSRFHADLAFIGIDSFLPGKGAFSVDSDSAEIGQALANNSDKCAVVADHSKFNAKGCFQIIRNTEIDYLITDNGLELEVREKVTSEPYELILA